MKHAEWLDVRREGAGLRAAGRLREDLPFLEGHFPGRPVLPGVVWVHWAIELAREHLGTPDAPSALESLKFHEPLLPGRCFTLRVGDDGGKRLHFEAEADGDRIASGRVRFDGAPAPHALPTGLRGGDVAGSGPWPLRIPQAPPMRFVERVRDHRDGVTLCQARIDSAAPFCRAGSAPSWLALEILAQGMAAQGGIAAGDRELRGLLVGARRVVLRTRGFAAGEALWVRAQHLRGETGLVACACALGRGEAPASAADAREAALAQGTLTALVESAKD